MNKTTFAFGDVTISPQGDISINPSFQDRQQSSRKKKEYRFLAQLLWVER